MELSFHIEADALENRANYDKSMKLDENTQFDMRNKKGYLVLFLGWGYWCLILRGRFYGRFLHISYIAMSLSKPTRFDVVKKIKVVPNSEISLILLKE